MERESTQFQIATEHYKLWCEAVSDHHSVWQTDHTVRWNNLDLTVVYVEYEYPSNLFEIGCMFAELICKPAESKKSEKANE